MKSKRYLIEALKSEGIEHVFLVPGGELDPLVFEFLEEGSIELICSAIEGGAAFMADGYSRSSNKFGVCAAIGGPGILNMVTAVATAAADHSPMLVISGDIPTAEDGKGIIQDSSSLGINTSAILAPIVSGQVEAHLANQIPFGLKTLMNKMLTPSSRGPVHLSMTLDIQDHDVPDGSTYKSFSDSLMQAKYLNEKAFEEAFTALAEGKKVVIYAGSEIRKSCSWELLTKFAEKYHIPVATTISAKGAISEHHELSLGTVGWVIHPYANKLILEDNIDVMLCIGAQLNSAETMSGCADFKAKKTIITYSSFHNVFQNIDYDFEVLGDSFSFLTKVLEVNDARSDRLIQSKKFREEWLRSVKALCNNKNAFDILNITSNNTPIHPARLVKALRDIFPQDTIMAIDSGAHMLFAFHYWTVTDPTQVITALDYMGTMGWAWGAVIGSKAALPKRPHVLFTGDACTLMHGMEIKTAVQYDLPVVFVISNNRAYGNPKLRAMKISEKANKFMDVPAFDFAALGRSLGAEGFTVRDPNELEVTLEKAYRLNKAVVVDVIVGNVATPTEIYDKYFAQSFFHGG